jgi:arabinogalactan oligomer/maltooligosaccharide transport system substrate-binding protein
MPSIPEMDLVWTELGGAELEILKGADPEDAMRSAGQDISDGLVGGS